MRMTSRWTLHAQTVRRTLAALIAVALLGGWSASHSGFALHLHLPDRDELLLLPGYVVPPETVRGALKEFLLVPYFGACIHTPPPPANQIVHVMLEQPVKGFGAMSTVWVSGRMSTRRQDSPMGASGYRLDSRVVETYRPPPS